MDLQPTERPAVRTLADAIRYGLSATNPITRAFQKRNEANFQRSLHDQRAFEEGRLDNALGAIGHLWLSKIGRDGHVEDYGLVSCRVVTNAGVAFIVDAFQNLVELENMKYHAVGNGTAAESAANTALSSELTTQYSTANTRISGTMGEKSGNANVIESTATITVSAAVAITEHGIFSTPAANSGVLLDRSVFAPVNLGAGESLQGTYNLTFPAGG